MHRSALEINKIVQKAIGLLKGSIEIECAYLFGSYARGNPHKYSDIDLAFFSPSVNKMGLDKKMTLLAKIEEELDPEVEIHLYSLKCLKEARATNFYGYILKTGKRVL